jgi:hypothetical protein
VGEEVPAGDAAQLGAQPLAGAATLRGWQRSGLLGLDPHRRVLRGPGDGHLRGQLLFLRRGGGLGQPHPGLSARLPDLLLDRFA